MAPVTPAPSAYLGRFETLLRCANFVDEDHYRDHGGIVGDVVVHYARIGWRVGLSPNPRFDGGSLAPFYRAAGLVEPPALIWLGMTYAGVTLPANAAEAEAVAAVLRATDLFEADLYAAGLPAGMDPALHYGVIGEALGWRASSRFDTRYYLASQPDVFADGGSPLVHFALFGLREGRRRVPAADELAFPSLPNDGRPTVLVIGHEASRTGAPVLGWNIVRGLAGRAKVVSLLLRGGSLEDDFAAVSDVLVGPLTAELKTPVELDWLIDRIVETYRPIYAVANSIETDAVVPMLARRGVPSVVLVHEFATYTRPYQRMLNVFDWAPHVIFPARVVARSSFEVFEGLSSRPGLHVLAQGRNDPPAARYAAGVPGHVRSSAGESEKDPQAEHRLRRLLDRDRREGGFLVVGLGFVQFRKGVDLFIAAAAAACRLRPELDLRFLWIGDGYDPVDDVGYSAFIAHQIAQSGLGDRLVMHDAVTDLEPVYAAADALFLSSRLDPQPNVAIDAMARGVPTFCFRGAGGTAEVLEDHPEAAGLVLPYLDLSAAAELICRLAAEPSVVTEFRRAVAVAAHENFDADAYVDAIDRFGRAAATAMRDEDAALIAAEGDVDPGYAVLLETPVADRTELGWRVLHHWQAEGLSAAPRHISYRRPVAGFNPQRYAAHHWGDCQPGRSNPLVHWLRSGRPKGPWRHEVFKPAEEPVEAAPLKCALHIHVYYADLIGDLAARLARNNRRCDLFVTTDSEAKADLARQRLAPVAADLEIAVLPNRGRDIGPFLLHVLPEMRRRDYAVIGHVHTKKAPHMGSPWGEQWREFLWENLVGGDEAMLDRATEILRSRPDLGLLMACDPHLVGWDKNRADAVDLAGRMGIDLSLPDHFDFPIGTMFWARPEALAPLMSLGLAWADMPDEPLPEDGTILHALERLLPFVAEKAGYGMGGLWVPGTTR